MDDIVSAADNRAVNRNDTANRMVRYRALIGEDAWRELTPAIRRRFGAARGAGETVIYRGRVHFLAMNRWGRILSRLCRLIGSPLPTQADGRDLPAIVAITEDRTGPGQFWTRVYGRRRGFPQIIHSAKWFSGPTGLEDYLGCGVSILLSIEARRNALIFRSEGYALRLFGRRVNIPRTFWPGRLTVGHHDRGNGRFVFSMELDHTVFGKLVEQRIAFSKTRDRDR